jgi:GDP-L-fucose synthase
MADACVFIMENRNFQDIVNQQVVSSKLQVENCKTTQKELPTTHHTLPTEVRNTHINIGTGKDISIKELAELIKNIIGFKGELYFNTEKPDGTMKKLTDVSKLNSLGWKYKMDLESGIKEMYKWYLQ